MAKVRKMRMGGFMPAQYDASATGGLGRVNTGSGTIGSALKTAKSAIGGGGGENSIFPIDPPYSEDDTVGGMPYRKKGGSIKKTKHMAGGGGMPRNLIDRLYPPSDSGDNTAFGGLREVQGGAGTIGSGLRTAAGAIGDDNEPYFLNNQPQYKKGGSAKSDSGRIHIGTSKISTAEKNKKHSNCW
jgi:hypothetical protein